MVAPNRYALHRELMNRSWKNYEYLKSAQEKGEDVYEVTQLISTFLIAVGHIRERQFEVEFRSLEIRDAQQRFNFPLIPIVNSRPRAKTWKESGVEHSRPFDPNRYVGDLIEFLRNAIAHGNIAFPNDEEGEEISLIELKNTYRGTERDWANLSVRDLEKITKAFVKLADAYFESRDSGMPAMMVLDKAG